MSVSFDGVGQVCATFLGTDITEGHVVKLTGSGTVGPCANGDAFLGVAVRARDGACSVQVRGFVTVPFSDSAPAAGWASLTADGSGGVKTAGDNGGQTVAVACVNSTDKTVTILL